MISLFLQNIPILPKAGRLKYFLQNWAKLTNNPTILQTVQCYNISLIAQPEQLTAPRVAIMSQEETYLIYQEVREMLRKGVNSVAKKSGVSVSELTVFGRKKGGRNYSVVDLKELNKILPYPHFKIECMYVSVKFTEYYTKSATRESEKNKNPMQRASREGTSNRQRNRQINRAVFVHSIISSSRVSAVYDFITPASSSNDFQIFSRGTIEPIKTGNGRATLVYINLSSWNRKSLISPPVQLIIISDLSNQGRRHYAKSKQQEIHGLRKRVKPT